MVQNLQDEMMDLMDVSSEIQETLGRSYSVPDGLDEDDLMGGKLVVVCVIGMFVATLLFLISYITIFETALGK